MAESMPISKQEMEEQTPAFYILFLQSGADTTVLDR